MRKSHIPKVALALYFWNRFPHDTHTILTFPPSYMAQAATIKPVAKYQNGALQIAVWPNEKGFSYSIQKSFKKKDAVEWTVSKISLFDGDLLILEDMIRNLKADREDNFKNN